MTLAPPRLRPTLLTALAVAAVLGGSLLAQTARAAKPKVGLIGCSHKLESRPKTYPLACGDENTGLVDVTWTTFGGTTARGSGTLAVNECEPNCAAGKVLKTHVQILARRPRTIGGLHSYSLVILTRTNGKPAGRYAIDKYGPYQSQP